jgi:hypothetical protein
MVKGTLLAESLTVGTTLSGIPLVVREVSRAEPVPPRDPPIWTAIEFEAGDADAQALAAALAAVIEERRGWYCNYSSASETWVVYHRKIFRYPRGDAAGRAAAQAYGREHGTPERELDWGE